MNKLLAIGIAFALLAFATPATAQGGSETVNAGYSVAFGLRVFHGVPDVPTGTALIACLGPPEQEVCEGAGIDPIGGYDATPEGSGYTHVEVTINDAVSSNNIHTEICVYTDSHSICDEETGDVSVAGCGILIEVDPPFGMSFETPVVGFAYTLTVDPATNEICVGTNGVAAAVYS